MKSLPSQHRTQTSTNQIKVLRIKMKRPNQNRGKAKVDAQQIMNRGRSIIISSLVIDSFYTLATFN